MHSKSLMLGLVAHATLTSAVTQLTPYALEGVTCINGETPYVFANVQSSVNDWVIQVGIQSVVTTFCISEFHCALFAGVPDAPAPAPAPMTVSNSGPQSDNCSVNPSFCKFNQAQISDCTLDLLLGNADVPSGNVTMHFQGVKLLKASLEKLASLGMASAERVLLHGNGWGGTEVILNADSVGAQLKSLVPTLKDYRAVAADGVHPLREHLVWKDADGPGGNVDGQPYDALTGYLKSIFNLSQPSGALSADCLATHTADPWMCLYVNETLPHITTPLFLVNQMASIWDTFFNIDGVQVQSALQIEGTPHGNDLATMEWHNCFQYVTRCYYPQIEFVIRPFQEQYINETLASGMMSRPGNGGFFHSCHSGGYWVSADADGRGQWQVISIGGLTMQQAVSNWWVAPTSAPSVFTRDCTWTNNAPFICNPICASLPGPYLADEEAITV